MSGSPFGGEGNEKGREGFLPHGLFKWIKKAVGGSAHGFSLRYVLRYTSANPRQTCGKIKIKPKIIHVA
jgi:hypothetical protein